MILDVSIRFIEAAIHSGDYNMSLEDHQQAILDSSLTLATGIVDMVGTLNHPEDCKSTCGAN